MGRIYREQLQGRVFSCRQCGTHLASNLDLISKVGRFVWMLVHSSLQGAC